jgi:hypothetical protein
VLIDYYIYRECINFPHFQDAVLEDVFEGGLEGMDGALISVLAALKLQSLVVSSSDDPYRSKVAEEMLLCEVIVQHGYA